MTVHAEAAGRVLVISIDRPERRNAIDGEHARAIAAAVDRLEDDPELWVGVLTGTDDCFCAGADLRARVAGEQVTDERGFASFTHRAREKPVIAAVEGVAFGGGLELVLACDLAVACTCARFALPEVKRSMLPAAGGAYRLGRLIPSRAATWMLLSGEPVTAARAAELGLLNEVVPCGQARNRAVEYSNLIAENAPLAVRATLRLARDTAGTTDEEAMRRTRAEYAALGRTEDYREGPRAFLEKRAPRWAGR